VICNQDAELTSALVFCRVRSWLTGQRVVSVPFSDHCTPLVANEKQLSYLISLLEQDRATGKYVELRTLSACSRAQSLAGAATYCLHRLDLRPSLSDLFQACHPNHVRRKIVRAEREGLVYEEGTSESLLHRFYSLAVLTRRRQHLPPQPLAWFRNLIACLGENLKIRLVSKDSHPAAGILTIQYKNTITYKYGFSDKRYHPLGVMQLLLWTTIEEAKKKGLLEFDLGRSAFGNGGLVAFKDHWGAARSSIVYVRSPAARRTEDSRLVRRLAGPVFAAAPDLLLMTVGNLLYRHVG